MIQLNQLILPLLLIPVLGYCISLLLPDKKEKAISSVAFVSVGLHLICLITLLGLWLFSNEGNLNLKEMSLFKSKEYDFFIDFYFDKITAVYLVVGSYLTLLVTIYSRKYLHREKGYKRFFNTILLFFVGYNVVILAGNFETLFLGWEILGISSFLLIAFYRERYLPVKNALKVFSVYRIGDVGLILAMWASHHHLHENITFFELHENQLVHDAIASNTLIGFFISFMILIAAAAKSAQLPFSSWLPRAMEGPTTSSAIFYGSLSVHIGAFLLMRTYAFWEYQYPTRILIAALGLSTAIVANLIARVQSSAKSQIAYSSISQIGIIFIEIACGFETLALIHFAGNAFLRSYQLLVSPSVVSYMIRDQFFNFVPKSFVPQNFKKLRYTLYMLSIKEFKLDSFMDLLIWKPLKSLGRKLDFLTIRTMFILFIPLLLAGLVGLYFQDQIAESLHHVLPAIYAFIGLIMVLKSHSERRSPKLSWLLLIINHCFVVIAVSFNEHFETIEAVYYLSGIAMGGAMGYYIMHKIQKQVNQFNLNDFHGHSYEYPVKSSGFLLAGLALMAFPISPTFIGVDLILSHIHEDQILLAFLIASSFICTGLSVMRIYTRMFLGPHHSSYHEIPYKNS
jgi:NADH-quinone oxidoreductase subunit L